MKTSMRLIVSGLRGGAGVTSVVAMLADALRKMKQNVLVVDLNPSDLLRLHFNIAYGEPDGWAYAQMTGQSWHSQIFEVAPALWVLPYGRQGILARHAQANIASGAMPNAAQLISQDLSVVSVDGKPQHIDWILFDAPFDPHRQSGYESHTCLHWLVAPVDVSAHILLGQYDLGPDSRILMNQRQADNELLETVAIDWTLRYQERLLPLSLPLDQHIQAALAQKMPVTTYYPESEAARAAESLAVWCLTQKTG